jgi:hypothetical protein
MSKTGLDNLFWINGIDGLNGMMDGLTFTPLISEHPKRLKQRLNNAIIINYFIYNL